MKEPINLHVNGVSHTVNVDPSTPLLYVLRNQLSLNGPKYGCGLQQCGACMVLVDGKAQTSYITSLCITVLLTELLCSLNFFAAAINETNNGAGLSTVLFNSG